MSGGGGKPTPDLTRAYLKKLGLSDDPHELLTPEEHAALNEHLAAIGWGRQSAAAKSGHLSVGGSEPMRDPYGDNPPRRGFGDHHTNPESDLAALRYELDGCRAEIERLRDLALELLGAGRGLMECMPPPSRMLPEDRTAIARWDAADAACAGPGVPGGGEGPQQRSELEPTTPDAAAPPPSPAVPLFGDEGKAP